MSRRSQSVRQRVLNLAIALLLFALALLPRIFTLDAFVTWDEPTWVFRSARFLEALHQARWADTAQAGHPGVITMWAGALGVAVHSAADPVAAQALADVLAAGELDAQDTTALRVLGEFLPLARLPVAVLTALTVAACYGLAFRLSRKFQVSGSGLRVQHGPRLEIRNLEPGTFAAGLPTALLAALLLAFDPFFLAHSRLLHVDALAASFMTLSLLSLLAHLADGQRLCDATLSGLCAALAVLTKSPAAFLVPFTLLVFGGYALAGVVRQRRGPMATGKGAAALPWRGLLLWSLAAALTLLAFWPALWSDPLRALRFVLGTAGRHATTPHVNNFWFGQVVRDPGLPFYLLAFAFRLTPVTGLGLLAALPLLARQGPHRTLLLGLSGYVVLFILALTAGAKKFDRYLLPVFPALDLVAAWGIVAGLRWLAKWRNLGQRASRAVLVAGITVAVLAQAAGTLPHHPYYLTYYNPLLGGGRRAVQSITVGWGEGLDQAVHYLNQQPAAEELEVAAWGVAGIAPLLRGHVHVLNEQSAVLADYVVLNVGDVQFGSPYISDYHGQAEPEYVVRLHGVEYAWVYRNDRYLEHLEALERLVGEGDVVVFAGRSQVSKYWPAERPRLVLDPAGDEAQIAQALNSVAQTDGTVWYVAFAGADAERDGVRRQLDTHALPVGQRALPPLTVTAYRILPETIFAPLRADVPVEASFAGRLSLVGLGLSGMRLAPSQKLDIILRWQAISPVEADYTAFVHLLDEEGGRLAQHDELLLDATGQPTSAWAVGEPHSMRFLLDISEDASPGDYVLVVGLYRADTGDRLWLDGVKGMQDNTAYPLAVVHIVAETEDR